MSQSFNIAGNWRHLFARHRDVKYWNTRSVDCVTPQGPPTTKMFTRKLTHLTIMTTVRPANAETQSYMNRQREEFVERHKNHNEKPKFHTINYFEENYLVSDDTLPGLFQPSIYRIFAFLGLSMPYRWAVFFSIGHKIYRIKKYVKEQDRQIQIENVHSLREFQLSAFQTTEISQSSSVYDQPPDYETVVNGYV